MSTTTTPSTRSGRTARWLKMVTIGAVILVPLAFAGLFIGALSQADTSLDRIPAAIVNNDTLVYTTAEDGTKSPVFAGRQLVTELTGGATGVDWTVTNDADAKKALASGKVYAVLTIPKDFSPSILSLSTQDAKRADLAITTDDAHSYLSGTVAKSVGEGMAATFGNAITAQYISGIYSSIGQLGSSLNTAAEGAGSLSSGASRLSDGLTTLAGGVASARGGATAFADGVGSYTGGVDSLSKGLAQLRQGAAGLTGVSQGVQNFTGSVSALAQALTAANAALQANPTDPVALATVDSLSAQLSAAAAGGGALSTQTSGAVTGIQSGIASSASGAARLSAGSSDLRTGATSLATGLSSLSFGAASASSGAGDLASGATSLADGLTAGAAKLPATDPVAAAANAKVAADPVSVTVTRDNKLAGIGQGIATFFVPLGLWIGALAIFLVLRPASRRTLGSTAGNGRLVAHTLARASAISAAQALLLVGLLHVVVGVTWAALPATLGFSLLMALAFTAFHYLLTVGLGRAGLVVSLFVLAVQVTATGGLYPVQLLATPFQWISPLLPLTYGVNGMQGIIAGGATGPIVVAVFVLILFGAGSALVSLLAIRRTRRARALGLIPLPAN
ncbi:MAG: YhgE/Pip family protein [Terrimesophilobacter sp.]